MYIVHFIGMEHIKLTPSWTAEYQNNGEIFKKLKYVRDLMKKAESSQKTSAIYFTNLVNDSDVNDEFCSIVSKDPRCIQLWLYCALDLLEWK